MIATEHSILTPDGDTAPADTAPRRFRVRRYHRGGAVVINVRGTIDFVTAPTLATHLDMATTGQPAVIIVDLLNVDLLTAVAVDLLIETHRLSKQAGITMHVVVCGQRTSRLTHLIKNNDALERYPTVANAVPALPASRSPSPVAVSHLSVMG